MTVFSEPIPLIEISKRRFSHVSSAPSITDHSRHQRNCRSEAQNGTLLELGELSRSKVIELNQRCVGQYVSLTRSFLTYNGSLSLTLVNTPPSTCAEWQASTHGGVSHENITFNSCIGDAAEFDC